MSQPLTFQFDIAAEVFEKAGEDESRERRIGGIVSTDHMDKQGEILIQDGLDFKPFLKGGWFNDNHSKATGDGLVGYPEFAELRQLPGGHKGWYVEGYLLKGHPPADSLWTVANSLQKSGRRLGFSVEGQILGRDARQPHIVRKAVVKEVAVTRCPVNGATNLDVLAKSLSAGAAVANPGAAPGEGFPLRVESLESRVSREDEDEKKKKRRRMTKSEAIELLMEMHPNVTRDFAERVVDYTLRWHPAT